MKAIFRLHELWEVVTIGVSRKGDEAAEKRKDVKALTLIQLRAGLQNLIRLDDAKSAKEAWDLLKELYQRESVANELGIRTQLMTCKFKDGEDLKAHIDKLERLAKWLRAVGGEYSDKELALQMLLSLPDSFRSIKQNLQSGRDPLTGNRVKIALWEEAQRLKLETGDYKTSVKFEDSSAYQVQEPDGKRDMSKLKCYRCGKIGHFKRNCYLKRHGNENGNRYATMFSSFMCFPTTSSDYHQERGNEPTGWILDSGAAFHFAKDQEWFTTYGNPDRNSIGSAKRNALMTIRGQGKVYGTTCLNKKESFMEIKNVYHVPDIVENLLSVSLLADQGYECIFGAKDQNGNHIAKVVSAKTGAIAAVAQRMGQMWIIPFKPTSSHVALANSDNLATWHKRLGHLGSSNIIKLQSMVGGIDNIERSADLSCEIYAEVRLTKQSFEGRDPKAKRSEHPLELVHTDVCGPIPTESLGGGRYFELYIDDNTHHVTAFILNKK